MEYLTIKASIVVLTKNPGSILQRVLRSVRAQQTPWDFETLVIDSGSVDGTVPYCRQLDGIRLHQIEPGDFGHGKTRNLGVALTRGEFIAFLTHDAVPANERWLVELVTAAEADPSVGGAFGRHIAHENATAFTRRDLQRHFDNFARSAPVVGIEDPERYKTDEHYRRFLHFFSDNNASIRRRVWQVIPYPQVDFAEDQLWAKQMLEAGYKKAYADRAVVYHSHDFGIWERLQRSFDESQALTRHFGYKPCPSLIKLMARAFKNACDDIRYSRKHESLLQLSRCVTYRPVHNVFHQLGLYLGQRASSLPRFMTNRISRDTTIRRGIN
jgi:rhamnosyltransferase